MNFASNPRAPFRLSSSAEPLTPPDGKPLIVHVVVNVEYWPYDELTPRTIVVPPHGRTHVPDLPNFCWSEYGNRCGLPRLLKLFSDRDLPVSASVNASVLDVYPEIASAVLNAGWEFVGHGYRQRALSAESNEREQIEAALDRLNSLDRGTAKGMDESRVVGNVRHSRSPSRVRDRVCLPMGDRRSAGSLTHRSWRHGRHTLRSRSQRQCRVRD